MSDDFENRHKLSYDIGKYMGSYNCAVRMFKLIFENEHLDKKRRIKYLANIELEMLKSILMECIASRHSDMYKDDIKYEKLKNEILEFLK